MAAEKLPGLILQKGDAELISQRKKTVFILSEPLKKYVDVEVFVVSEGKAFAKIVFQSPNKIGLKKFKSMQMRHKISEEERKKRWPKKRTFYAYKIRLKTGYSPPIEAEYPDEEFKIFTKEVAVNIQEQAAPVEKQEDPIDSFEQSFITKRSGIREEQLPLNARRLDDFIPDLEPDDVMSVITEEMEPGEEKRTDHGRRNDKMRRQAEGVRIPTKKGGLKSRVEEFRSRTSERMPGREHLTSVREPNSVKEVKKSNSSDDLLSKFKKLLGK